MSDVLSKTIADKIRIYMGAMGINAKQLAHRAKVGRSFVYDILNGKSSNPTFGRMVAISQILNIPISCLVEDGIEYDDARNSYIMISRVKDDGTFSNPQLFYNVINYSYDHSKQLFVYKISDDYMFPLFKRSDSVILIESDSYPNENGIFLFKYRGRMIFGRIEILHLENEIRIIPENARYSSIKDSIESVSVMGKAIHQINSV